MLNRKIDALFAEYPQVLYGFTSIEYSSFYPAYRSALVFAVPYGGQLTLSDYTEAGFEQGIADARKLLEEIVGKLEAILKETGARYLVPPVAQSSEETLLAPFSFKFAAVQAGLGWIGKNDVVITERYGPRVRLSAVLIDETFPYGASIEESRCPDGCRKCVDACPFGALTGARWNIRSLRSDLIDYRLCNRKRSLFIPRLGRKSACGLCLAACPIGTKR